MDRKNKRTILITSIYIMGMGILILSAGQLHPILKNKAVAGGTESSGNLQVMALDTGENRNAIQGTKDQAGTTTTPSPAPTPTPTPVPTPTPLPVYELKEGGYPKIDALFQDYYVARNSCDTEKLKNLFSDPSVLPSPERLKAETMFIDDIRKITCHTMKSYEDGAYIVYVSYELKYMNIKTPAPYLDKFYVITDQEGTHKIHSPEGDETLMEYYASRDEDPMAQKLYEDRAAKYKEAMEKDVDLRVYLEALSD